MIPERIQSFFISAGNYACYALCLIKLAEEETGEHIDIVVALRSGIEKKYIHFNYSDYSDANNFYVYDAGRFLSMLTDGVWRQTAHRDGNYKPAENEKVIQRWERKTSAGSTSHFRLKDWDSLEDSQTVKYGQIVSTRVFVKLS